MTTLPAAGYFSDADREWAEAKAAQDQVLDWASEQLGGGAESELTIASGDVTPPAQAARSFTIDTESDDGSDDLDHIVATNVPDGSLLQLRLEDASRIVTLKHATAGAGQLSLRDGRDLRLDAVGQRVTLQLIGTTWHEINRTGFLDVVRKVVADSDGGTIAESDSGTTFHNTGASGLISFALPAAVVGLEYDFVSLAAHAIEINANGSDVIQDGATQSVAGGEIQSSGALRETLRLRCLVAGAWVVMFDKGTWTVT